MSADPSLAIQDAVEDALRDDAGVTAEFDGTTRLYTMSAPNGAPYPYIVIGEDQIIGDDTECASGSEVVVTVHVWARATTPTETRRQQKRIAGAVRAALVQPLALDGHTMDEWELESLQHLTDPDGLTGHSVLSVRYLTTATA